MEMRLIQIANEVYTRLKVQIKQYPVFKRLLKKYGAVDPVRKSSRFIYFEVKGDLLNTKKVRHE